jgi:hypothetical protein
MGNKGLAEADSVSMGNKGVICTILVQFAGFFVSVATRGLRGEVFGEVEKA